MQEHASWSSACCSGLVLGGTSRSTPTTSSHTKDFPSPWNASKCSREPDRPRKKQDPQGLVTFHSGITTPNSPCWFRILKGRRESLDHFAFTCSPSENLRSSRLYIWKAKLRAFPYTPTILCLQTGLGTNVCLPPTGSLPETGAEEGKTRVGGCDHSFWLSTGWELESPWQQTSGHGCEEVLRLDVLRGEGRPTLNVDGTILRRRGSWVNDKGSRSQFFFSVPHYGCKPANYPKPCFHDGPHPQTVSQNKTSLLLGAFLRYFAQLQGK